jgi:hypothetical protein
MLDGSADAAPRGYQGPREKKLKLTDVIEMFLEMSGMTPFGTTSLLACSASDDLKQEICSDDQATVSVPFER